MPPASQALMPPGKASGFLSWQHGTAYGTGDPGENDLQDHSREPGRRAPPTEPRTQAPPLVLRFSLVANGIPKGIRFTRLVMPSVTRTLTCVDNLLLLLLLSCSVVSDSVRPHGLQPTRLLRPWDSPGKSTGVGCHCLLRCG